MPILATPSSVKDEALGVQISYFNVSRNYAGKAARTAKSMFTDPLKRYVPALRLLHEHRQFSASRRKIIRRRHARCICDRTVI